LSCHISLPPYPTPMASPNPQLNLTTLALFLTSKWFKGAQECVVSGHRYYSPELGRWMSRDPIGQRGGVNLLGFALNSPVSTVDALGNMPTPPGPPPTPVSPIPIPTTGPTDRCYEPVSVPETGESVSCVPDYPSPSPSPPFPLPPPPPDPSHVTACASLSISPGGFVSFFMHGIGGVPCDGLVCPYRKTGSPKSFATWGRTTVSIPVYAFLPFSLAPTYQCRCSLRLEGRLQFRHYKIEESKECCDDE